MYLINRKIKCFTQMGLFVFINAIYRSLIFDTMPGKLTLKLYSID